MAEHTLSPEQRQVDPGTTLVRPSHQNTKLQVQCATFSWKTSRERWERPPYCSRWSEQGLVKRLYTYGQYRRGRVMEIISYQGSKHQTWVKLKFKRDEIWVGIVFCRGFCCLHSGCSDCTEDWAIYILFWERTLIRCPGWSWTWGPPALVSQVSGLWCVPRHLLPSFSFGLTGLYQCLPLCVLIMFLFKNYIRLPYWASLCQPIWHHIWLSKFKLIKTK